ncbi:hypothetical protein V6N13_085976 [Hibiscus sabdariffa]
MLNCAEGVLDKTIINCIMLRFSPIAPKPVNGDSVSGGSAVGNKNTGVTSKRVGRKYVRVPPSPCLKLKKTVAADHEVMRYVVGSDGVESLPREAWVTVEERGRQIAFAWIKERWGNVRTWREGRISRRTRVPVLYPTVGTI